MGAAVLLGLAVFLPGNRRPPAPGAPPSWVRYRAHLLGLAVVLALVAAFRWLQPLATPTGIAALEPGLTGALGGLDAGLRAGLAPVTGEALDLVLGGALLLLHPAMLVLAPVLWMAADEERPAKEVLTAYAVFLVLAAPLHFLLPVGALAPRPFPALQDLGALYFPPGDVNKLPSLHTGLAMCVALAARRSRNWRFRPLAFLMPVLVAAGLFYHGINGLLGIGSGAALAALAMAFAERANSVERIVHQRIDASPERKMAIRQGAEALLARLREELAQRGWTAEPKLVGSVAKDTFLAHKVDLDAFVLFPPDTPRRELEERGLALGRAVLGQPEARFAEHPYLAGKWQGLDAEVVPAFKVEPGQTLSAVDRTPFHTEYVQRHLEGLRRRDVRLLKQFLLGIGVYGAEAKVQGFSGYLAELLVLKYGSFRGVLRAGADWRVGQLLALEPFEGAPRFTEPLVVIDPVDARRNVASAVSLDKLLLFQEAARAYLKEPRISFFFPRATVPWSRARLRELTQKRGHALVALRVEKPDVLDDSLHAQLRKCAQALIAELERGGFKPRAWEPSEDQGSAGVLLELESLTVNEREVHEGPPSVAKEHAERFRAKWTGNPRALSAVAEEKGRLVVARRREFTNAAALLRAKALDLDLGKDLTAQAKAKGFEVLDTDAALKELDAALLTRFVQRAKPWER